MMDTAAIKAEHARSDYFGVHDPRCMECRDIGGSPLPWPCDAATLLAEHERLVEALESIAHNTCCCQCQEAARLARTSIRGGA